MPRALRSSEKQAKPKGKHSFRMAPLTDSGPRAAMQCLPGSPAHLGFMGGAPLVPGTVLNLYRRHFIHSANGSIIIPITWGRKQTDRLGHSSRGVRREWRSWALNLGRNAAQTPDRLEAAPCWAHQGPTRASPVMLGYGQSQGALRFKAPCKTRLGGRLFSFLSFSFFPSSRLLFL